MDVSRDPTRDAVCKTTGRASIGHRSIALIGLVGLTDGGVEVGPHPGLVLGFVKVVDDAEAVGVAVTRFGEQHVGGPE